MFKRYWCTDCEVGWLGWPTCWCCGQAERPRFYGLEPPAARSSAGPGGA